ncbi:GABBR [Mytilus edulis]|uniref:GABBR n=1 Tax=Mytilus edulis TaxID=6550 RepID=A0A8S3VA36_MYTED|nr:GABBR [Mytilus edulis]
MDRRFSYSIWIVVTLYFERIYAEPENRLTEIVIAGLFPTSYDIEAGEIGRGVRPAVKLALDMVNNNTEILPGYDLQMTWNDTQCDMAKATKIFFDMMHENTTKVMLFGDACPNVTGPLAQISKWWNMSQLSYADTDPKLSDRSTYSNFFRTVPSDRDFNPAKVAFLKRYNWTRVATLFQDASIESDRYGIAHNKFIQVIDDANIEVLKVESFLDDPSSAVENIKKLDARIIVGFFNETMARKIFCSVTETVLVYHCPLIKSYTKIAFYLQAFQQNMYGKKYQWILVGGYSKKWFSTKDISVPCRKHEVLQAAEGYLMMESLILTHSNERTASGLTPKEYKKHYNDVRDREFSVFHGYAFDGIWVIAKAIDTILRNRRYPTNVEEHFFRGDSMALALNETDFIGVTGRVHFDGPDRIGLVSIKQLQDKELKEIGTYDRSTDELVITDKIQWTGNGPPMDRNLVRTEMLRVSPVIYSGISVLASIGIIIAVVFLVINIIFRHHRYIKMSSPNMNNIIIIGCMVSYASVYLLGSEGGSMKRIHSSSLCVIRSWFLAVGFSLSFGAMFTKTWRVHAIFTNIKLNKKIIHDYKLFCMVFTLVLLDAIILTTWQIMDPLYKDTRNLSSYVFGCFLAWDTRHVTISALNDSKYIGMSVYNVVMMCLSGAAISFVINDKPNPEFIIISLLIIFCTTITLCLVFVPKIVELKIDPRGDDRRIRATLKRNGKKKEENGPLFRKDIKDVEELNKHYKEIIKQKRAEIRNLLEQLGEDPDSFVYKGKYTLGETPRKTVVGLRISDSPTKVSRVSSTMEGEDLSMCSEYTNTWSVDTSQVRKRLLLMSTKSVTSSETTNTDSIELTDLRKCQNIRMTNMRQSSYDEQEEFGGVYLGPPECNKIQKCIGNINGRNHVIPNNKINEEMRLTDLSLTVKYNAISDVDSLSSFPGIVFISIQ